MSSKLFEIARACFIGGFVLCIVALLIIPTFWWLGILAGLASGYLAYEFREVRRAVPKALTAVNEDFTETLGYAANGLRKFAAQPHPFAYPSILVGMILFGLIWYKLWTTNPQQGVSGFLADLIFGFILSGFLSLLAACLMFLSIRGVAILGAERGAKVFWQRWDLRERTPQQRIQSGLIQKPLTYANAYLWLLGGIVLMLLSLVVGGPIGLVRFVVALIRLIHSNERVLCGVDGTLGGLIALWAFWHYAPASDSLIIAVFVAVCGGALGAALGIADWKFISKGVFGFGEKAA